MKHAQATTNNHHKKNQCRKNQGKKNQRKKNQRGLSLIELIVVIVILGVLGTLIVVNVLPAADNARVQTTRNNIGQLENALDQYRLDLAAYPTTDQGLRALTTLPDGLANAANYRPGGYIRKLPRDPWGNEFQYVYPGQHGEFDIYSYGADGREGGEGLNADIGNWDAQ